MPFRLPGRDPLDPAGARLNRLLGRSRITRKFRHTLPRPNASEWNPPRSLDAYREPQRSSPAPSPRPPVLASRYRLQTMEHLVERVSSLEWTSTNVALAAAAALTVYTLAHLFRNFVLSPIKHVPGPMPAAATCVLFSYSACGTQLTLRFADRAESGGRCRTTCAATSICECTSSFTSTGLWCAPVPVR